MPAENRPLSPHLQIYRLPLNAILSISHRISGIMLAGGAAVVVYWLIAAASGPEAYATAHAILGNFIVQILIFLWTYVLFYHLCNGIRHLVFDAGYGFHLDVAYKTGIATLVTAGVLTILAWIIALAV